jgi:hypothetical protein
MNLNYTERKAFGKGSNSRIHKPLAKIFHFLNLFLKMGIFTDI